MYLLQSLWPKTGEERKRIERKSAEQLSKVQTFYCFFIATKIREMRDNSRVITWPKVPTLPRNESNLYRINFYFLRKHQPLYQPAFLFLVKFVSDLSDNSLNEAPRRSLTAKTLRVLTTNSEIISTLYTRKPPRVGMLHGPPHTELKAAS